MGKADTMDLRVGHRVRALRLQRGLSQGELGAAIGSSIDEIRQFEAGLQRIGAARLMRIARAFEIDVGELFEPTNTGAPGLGGGRPRPTTSRSLH